MTKAVLNPFPYCAESEGGGQRGKSLQPHDSLRAAALRATMSQAALPSENIFIVSREALQLSELLQGGVSLQGGSSQPNVTSTAHTADQLPHVRLCGALIEAPMSVRAAASNACQLLAMWAQVTLSAYCKNFLSVSGSRPKGLPIEIVRLTNLLQVHSPSIGVAELVL